MASWFTFFDLGQQALHPIALPSPAPRPSAQPSPNAQTAADFAAEAARIAAASPAVTWQRPSTNDADREVLDHITIGAMVDDGDAQPEEVVVGAGARRGVVLHRLMEELIMGLVAPELDALTKLAAVLVAEAPADRGGMPPVEQLAATALRTFSHEALAPFRNKLVAEVPLYGSKSENVLISARADAIALDADISLAAFDWKSDVDPTDAVRRGHKGQLAQYLQLMGAPIGAVVYMTKPAFHWIRQDGSDANGP
jgi:hypothetical protein